MILEIIFVALFLFWVVAFLKALSNKWPDKIMWITLGMLIGLQIMMG